MKLSESTITSQMQKEIEKLVETKITHVLGGRKAKANINFNARFKVAVQFLHDLYEYFNITVYSEIKALEFETVKQYIMEWKPNVNLKREIEQLNKKGESL